MVLVGFFFNVCEIGNSNYYIQHGLASVKHIFLHASPNVPVHFTRLEYITSVVVSVAGKNPLDAGQCLILHQSRYWQYMD